MVIRVFLLSIFTFLFLCFTTIGYTEEGLKPEEIVIVVNADSEDSLRLGRLYIELRKIPVNHLVTLNVTTNEYISRDDYDELIAEPTRKIINGLHDQGEKVRCIVTTYGMPLRIGPARPLIVPGEKIERYIALRKEKKEELSDLRSQRKKHKGSNKVLAGKLTKEIEELKNEVDNLNLEIEYLEGTDTIAAVDSELALLLMPDYQIKGWYPNPHYLYNQKHVLTYFGRILMVSRLDAPTPELAEELVRTALEVEKTGLHGNFYLDARGLRGKGPYGKFDEEIRRTAEVLKEGLMPIVLDNKPGLFGPGDAPSAALYCGWYSLGKYVDAFEWSKGAVGYHVASAEAVSLHNPSGKYWVKSMIEKGVIATLGPVREPYLQAFPPPSVFFQLLMSGKYSLAEVFAMSNPYLSWQMVLIGDPLYNPFRIKPPYPLKDAPPPPD